MYNAAYSPVTIVDTLATSYVTQYASSAGAAVEACALGHEASEFLNDLGRRLSPISDDARETSHLFQRVSVLFQRYSAVAFRGSFIEEDDGVSG